MPSGGPTIAKAYVAIIPTTRDAQKNITKELTPALGEAGQEGGEKLSGGIASSLKSGAAKLAGIAKAAIAGAGAAAITKLVHDSVGAFSQFEQLSGGVQKIFDELDTSAIISDAQNAYKTLGISANSYLKSMTDVGATFAATLGDAKGYEIAREGMQSIADYASGTGRSVDVLTEKYTMITRATSSYQSIADQFAGILPATSKDFLAQAQAAGLLSDQYTELTQVPLPEYQEALTKMMTRGVDALGLLGNTAAEATSTLEGSTNMLKASWENMLTALGTGSQEDIQNSFSALGESLVAYLGNLKPRMRIIYESILSVLPMIGQAIIDAVPDIVAGFVDSFDQLLRSAGLDSRLGDILSGVMDSEAMAKIREIAAGISEALPQAFALVQQAAGTAGEFIGRFIDFALQGIQIAQEIGSKIGETLSTALSGVDFGAIFDKARETLDLVLGLVSEIGASIAQTVGDIDPGVMTDVFSSVRDVILDVIGVMQQIDIKGIFESAQPALAWLLDVGGRILAVVIDVGSKAIELSKNVGAALSNVFGDIDVEAVFSGIAIAIGAVIELGTQAIETVGGAISSILDSIDEETLTAIFASLRDFATWIISAAGTIGAIVYDVCTNLIFPTVSEIAGFIAEHVVPGITKILQAAEPVLKFIGEAIQTVGGVLFTLVHEIIIGILMPAISDIMEVAGAVFDFISGIIAGIIEAITHIAEFISGSISATASFIENAIRMAAGVIGVVIATIRDAAGNAFNAAKDFAINAWNNISDKVRSVVDAIKGFVSGIGDGVRNAFESARDSVIRIWDSIKRKIEDGVGAISDVVGGIADSISGAFESAFSGIKRIWNDTVGKISFRVPDWIPGIGGSDWSVPKLAAGGDIKRPGTVLVGEAGPELLSLPRGARVAPLDSATAADSGTTYQVVVGDVDLSDDDQVRRITREYLEYLAALARPALT